jgi:hypothetical protein
VPLQNTPLVLHYRLRADSIFAAARDLDVLDRDDVDYWPAIGLLAVHGCMALADALLVATEGDRSSSEDHATAVRSLRKWCAATRVPDNGVKHFEWLISNKTRFAYGERWVRTDDLKLAKVKMDQFFAWAFSAFPAVAQLRGDSEND